MKRRRKKCKCNGCYMIKWWFRWWCPHMEKTENIERHVKWQEANDLPPFLCKYRLIP